MGRAPRVWTAPPAAAVGAGAGLVALTGTCSCGTSVHQLGCIGSDFSVHLPPASPILLYYFVLPSRQDPMHRLVRYALAITSWMHTECIKYQRFLPLPGMRGVNVHFKTLT